MRRKVKNKYRGWKGTVLWTYRFYILFIIIQYLLSLYHEDRKSYRPLLSPCRCSRIIAQAQLPHSNSTWPIDLFPMLPFNLYLWPHDSLMYLPINNALCRYCWSLRLLLQSEILEQSNKGMLELPNTKDIRSADKGLRLPKQIFCRCYQQLSSLRRSFLLGLSDLDLQAVPSWKDL